MPRDRKASIAVPRRRSSTPLYRVLGTGLRAELKRLGRHRHEKRAAVAYVTSDEDVAFCKGDILIVDASDAMIAGGQTDAEVLCRAFARGALLYNLQGLHAKLFLFGDVAVVGSANLSRSALFEAGLVTTDHVVVSGVASLIDEMARRADVIDGAFLDRVSRIPVTRRFSLVAKTRGFRPVMVERGHRTWLVSVEELRDDAFPDEEKIRERGSRAASKNLRNRRSDVSWIRFVGKSRFRDEAEEGDSVIQIYTPLGAKRSRVLRHSWILRAQEEPTCKRFYVESSSDEDRRGLSWTEFLRLSVKVGWGRVSERAIREIPEEIARDLKKHWPKGA